MRRVGLLLAPVFLLILVLPAYVRVYSVVGDSDAPTFRDGDTALGLLASYDLTLPYTDVRIARMGDPRMGDIILFDGPGIGTLFKRVVAGPGDTVEIRDHRLVVNGKEALYDRLSDEETQGIAVPAAAVPRREIQGPSTRLVFLSGDPASARFGPLAIPEGYYFVIGDHRAQSRDSRHFGAVARGDIVGRIVTKLTSGSPRP